jgi:hypothetical protein
MSNTTWGWLGMLSGAIVIGVALGSVLTYAVLFTLALIGDTFMRFFG